jgi:acyl-CoA thioesterase
MRLVRMHSDGVTISCAIRPELLNAASVLHGGVTATLADVAVGMAVVKHLRGSRAITTVEMKVNYLRAVTGRKIVARARLVRVGSTLAIGKVDLHDDQGRLVAIALVTYMILANPHPLLTRAVSPARKPRRSRGKPR